MWTGGHHDLCDFKDHGCDDDHYHLDIHDLVDHVYNDDHDNIYDHGFVDVTMTIVTISLQAIADHGLVRKLGFTGSTEIGHTIMRLCHHFRHHKHHHHYYFHHRHHHHCISFKVLRGLKPQKGFPRAWRQVPSHLLCRL